MTNLLGVLKLCEEITPRDLTQRSRKHLPGQKHFAGANKLLQKSCPLVQRGEGGWVQIVVAGDSAHDCIRGAEARTPIFRWREGRRRERRVPDLIPEKYERFAFSRFAWLFPSRNIAFVMKDIANAFRENGCSGGPRGYLGRAALRDVDSRSVGPLRSPP